MKKASNPPDALSLMTSARSFGNYDLAGALADLIDNSVTAKARNVWVTCIYNEGDPRVSIIDDGVGMGRERLYEAMRPASTNPSSERSPDDLGRFGWGMKSASFSQCRKLTVFSRQNGIGNGAQWDLDAIDDWSMGVLTNKEVSESASEVMPIDDGTEVRWENCDRMSENGSIFSDGFNDLITHAMDQLALVFHRFLEGKADRPKLSIHFNGKTLEPFDPFHTSHNATIPLECEPLEVGGEIVNIRPYILPHFSKLKENEHERLGGREGFLRNQGFYVYRNHRLIIHGTWFRLAKYGELSQLIRISVDIPNSMDDMWKITVDKSDAQLPTVLRNRLKQIINGLKRRSTKVYRQRAGRIDDPGTVAVWSRYTRNNEISYSINREHPIIAQILESGDAKMVDAAMRLIEQNFPVSSFMDDTALWPNGLAQSAMNRDEMKRLLDVTTPEMLHQCGGDMQAMIQELKRTEPFTAHWPMVQEYLEIKGWSR